ncbi:hypothetical protein [Streptomyces ossamyceticus]|uniref:Uncharacterized protein n=1 Tax=Streptomyces ossamyceticus TaxID=249581 RepID=A0ABV2UYK7_9ACTN
MATTSWRRMGVRALCDLTQARPQVSSGAAWKRAAREFITAAGQRAAEELTGR